MRSFVLSCFYDDDDNYEGEKMTSQQFQQVLWPEFGRKVSCVGFGGGAISGEGGGYGFGPMTDYQAQDLLQQTLDAGINFYDTAPIYGFGLSEKRLGMAFGNKLREQVIIASKGGVTWHSNQRVNLSNRPEIIEKMLHQSLKDLRSDYIDLYFIHWPDAAVDIRYPLEVLAKAKSQGKIHHIGLSNTNGEDFLRASEVEHISAVEMECNFFSNNLLQELQQQLLQNKNSPSPFALQLPLPCITWGTLDKGILSGQVTSEKQQFASSDCRSWAPWWKKSPRLQKIYAVTKLRQNLQEIWPEFPLLQQTEHTERGETLCLLSLAVAFAVSNARASTSTELFSPACPLVGIKNATQLQDLLLAVQYVPGAEVLGKAQGILLEAMEEVGEKVSESEEVNDSK